MKLFHFTPTKIELNKNRRYLKSSQSTTARKPSGFWVSVEYSWREQMRDVIPSFFGHAYAVNLKPNNILYISSEQDFDNFLEKYSYEYEPFKHSFGKYFNNAIDWLKLAADYDGIIFTDYFHKRRNDYSWYYAWDCAGGCIWNLECIDNIEYVGKS